MPKQLQVTRITNNKRITLGKAMPALDADIGDFILIMQDDQGVITISKVRAEHNDGLEVVP